MVAQLQKSVLQTERKLEKEVQTSRAETREVMEKLAETIDKRMKELVG
jgi:DNA-binding FadR family transcriptional regulator